MVKWSMCSVLLLLFLFIADTQWFDNVWIGLVSTLEVLVSRHPLMRVSAHVDWSWSSTFTKRAFFSQSGKLTLHCDWALTVLIIPPFTCSPELSLNAAVENSWNQVRVFAAQQESSKGSLTSILPGFMVHGSHLHRAVIQHGLNVPLTHVHTHTHTHTHEHTLMAASHQTSRWSEHQEELGMDAVIRADHVFYHEAFHIKHKHIHGVAAWKSFRIFFFFKKQWTDKQWDGFNWNHRIKISYHWTHFCWKTS